ncbi:MAG TPA: hypothetical protein VGX25_19885 [Actinophytocola sp.]|uniref:hypothetical protein n=1 Tax=Actinophytocola sp. TaxID=1872138 RepID=UPI002DDD5CFC|nr:hypothetical protein [Actinophytocola sp.]HEV2781651.1 hypothetical protein [Actinophytocola sp.]
MSVRTVLLAAALLALVSGCSGGEAPASQVASISGSQQPSGEAPAGDDGKTDEDKAREYAKCMRDHGVNMKDPEITEGGGVGLSIEGTDPETVKKAETECKSLLPNGGKPPTPDAEQLDRMRETAKCLREHGINVQDPTVDDPGIKIEGGDKEKVDEAMKACGESPPAGGAKVEGRSEPTR